LVLLYDVSVDVNSDITSHLALCYLIFLGAGFASIVGKLQAAQGAQSGQ
jgi:hypothetical protein